MQFGSAVKWKSNVETGEDKWAVVLAGVAPGDDHVLVRYRGNDVNVPIEDVEPDPDRAIPEALDVLTPPDDDEATT